MMFGMVGLAPLFMVLALVFMPLSYAGGPTEGEILMDPLFLGLLYGFSIALIAVWQTHKHEDKIRDLEAELERMKFGPESRKPYRT